MTYTELIEELHSSNPNPHYYHILISNAKIILMQAAISSQKSIATDLNMTASAFNTIYKVLKEYVNDEASI